MSDTDDVWGTVLQDTLDYGYPPYHLYPVQALALPVNSTGGEVCRVKGCPKYMKVIGDKEALLKHIDTNKHRLLAFSWRCSLTPMTQPTPKMDDRDNLVDPSGWGESEASPQTETKPSRKTRAKQG